MREVGRLLHGRASRVAKSLEIAKDDAKAGAADKARSREPGESVEDLETLEVVERRHVMRVLRAVDDNKTVAARILGIGRKTLYRMLERWRAPASADADVDVHDSADGSHR
jgi:DNA-binding NtrC family response regulator